MKIKDLYLTETIEASQDLRSLLDQIEQGLKDNAEYIKKHGNPSIYEATEIATGQCFKHAFELSIQLHNQMRAAFSYHSPDGTGETDTDIRLVHAVVTRPTDGFRFIHAFVRQGDVIWDCDPSGNPQLAGRIETNYKANNINKNDPKLYREYTPQQAQTLVVKTRSYNPWDIKYEIDPETQGIIPKGDSMPNMVPMVPEGDVTTGNFGSKGPYFDIQQLQKVYNDYLNAEQIDVDDADSETYELVSSTPRINYYVKRSDQDVKIGTVRITTGEWILYRQADNEIANLDTPSEELDELLAGHSKTEWYPHEPKTVPIPGQPNTYTDVFVDAFNNVLPGEMERVKRMSLPDEVGPTKPTPQKPKLTIVPDPKTEATSSPGRVKRAGASCKGSVAELRRKAKKYSGEKGKMYHWCANMKGGKKK